MNNTGLFLFGVLWAILWLCMGLLYAIQYRFVDIWIKNHAARLEAKWSLLWYFALYLLLWPIGGIAVTALERIEFTYAKYIRRKA